MEGQIKEAWKERFPQMEGASRKKRISQGREDARKRFDEERDGELHKETARAARLEKKEWLKQKPKETQRATAEREKLAWI